MLGYTQASWDNLSGQEQQPWSSIKSWASLTDIEKEGAAVLGYTDITWDNDSGSEAQPASANKGWAELSACGDGEDAFVSIRLASATACSPSRLMLRCLVSQTRM